jgi:sugar transferase (PEP-CTERM system associated)
MVNVLIQRGNRRSMALAGCETVLITGAVALSAYVLLGDRAPGFTSESIVWKSLLIALVCQICLYYADLYEFGMTADRRELLARILKALGVSTLILATLYFWFPALIIGEGVVAVAVLIAVALAIGWRIVFVWFARSVAGRQRFLIVGTNAAALSFARELQGRTEMGVEIVGFVDDDAPPADPAAPSGVIGTIADSPAIVRARSVDRVIVSLAEARGKLPMSTLLQMKLDGVNFAHLASVYEEYTGKIAVEHLRPSWLIFADGFRKTRGHAFVKRALDVVGSAAALFLLFPVMLTVAVAVRLTSHGPVLYRQRRVGQNGQLFYVHKFRSMCDGAEAATGPVWAAKGDARITPLGGFLRRTRLDELPQLWNILAGHMSLVGPRPERPEFVSTLTLQIPFYAQRHIVKPGLTGWAQVRYTYGASVEDALEKLQYDLFYIKHTSIAMDVLILLETIKTVVLRRGA